jgi:hypothetical protein
MRADINLANLKKIMEKNNVACNDGIDTKRLRKKVTKHAPVQIPIFHFLFHTYTHYHTITHRERRMTGNSLLDSVNCTVGKSCCMEHKRSFNVFFKI